MAAIACVVLAAGRSRRFGEDKMLQRLPSGKSIVETTVNQYLNVFEQLTVVVRSAATFPLCEHPRLKLVEVDDSSRGLSDSLRAGLKANQTSDGWLIALGDMPYIQSAIISELRNSLTQENIVVPMLQGRQGNPVGFGSAFQNQILRLRGDVGAKSIIQENADRVISIATTDRGVVHDIDRPSDIV